MVRRSSKLLLLISAVLLSACPQSPPGDASCEPNPCLELNRGVCTVTGEGVNCGCDSGFVDQEGRCVAANPCDPNPCTEMNRGVCVPSGTQATCECEAGFERAGDACVPVTAACSNEHGGDAFEPDECPDRARLVDSDGLTDEPHTLEPAEDQDWFRVEARARNVYRFAAVGQGVDLSTYVFASDGTTRLASQSGTSPELFVRASSDGALYFRVRSNTEAATGPYTASVQWIAEDDHGNDAAASTSISAGSDEQAADFEYVADRDWFSFDAQAGHIYGIRCVLPDAGCGARVFDEAGVEVYRVPTAPPQELALKLNAGRSSIELYPLGETIGPYVFTLEDRGTDDHGDLMTSASTLPSDTDTPGAIQFEGDLDVFGFSATAGKNYEFSCTRGGDLTACILSLHHANGSYLAGSTGTGDAKLQFYAGTAGSYFLHVLGRPDDTGAYFVRATDIGADDYGNSRATANPLSGPYPISVSGRIEIAADLDYHSFPATAGTTYVVTATTTNGLSLDLQLLDVSGVLVVQDNSTPYEMNHTPSTDGTLVVKVASRSSGPTGNYALTITALIDDHGDVRADATPITWVNGTASGTAEIETIGDVDMLSFSATAGKIYRFTCNDTVLPNCNLRVWGATGPALATDNSGQALLLWEAPSTGTFFVSFAGNFDERGQYEWMVEETALSDDHGDDIATATPVSLPAAGTANLELPGDVDVFRFSATAGKVYRLSCTPTGFTSCNLTVRNSGDAGTINPSQELWKAPSDGHFFVRISSAAASSGAYSWSFEETAMTDDHGDQIATATPVTFTAGVATGSAEMEVPSDVDFLEFQATAGIIYSIGCSDGTLDDCAATLRDSTGALLVGSTLYGDSFRWKSPTTGPFYAAFVSNSGVGTYTWTISETTQVDDHGDTFAAATAVSFSGPLITVTARRDAENDVDALRIGVVVGRIYLFVCPNCRVSLLNSSETAIASDFYSPGRILMKAGFTGDLALRIEGSSGPLNYSYPTYTVELEDLGPDDHVDNAGPDATVIAPGVATAGRIESPGDVDFFQIQLVSGTTYQALNPATGSTAMRLGVYSGSGTALFSTTTFPHSFTVPSSGTWFVRVQADSSSSTGNYQVQIN